MEILWIVLHAVAGVVISLSALCWFARKHTDGEVPRGVIFIVTLMGAVIGPYVIFIIVFFALLFSDWADKEVAICRKKESK